MIFHFEFLRPVEEALTSGTRRHGQLCIQAAGAGESEIRNTFFALNAGALSKKRMGM
jgi:hypothetical protein